MNEFITYKNQVSTWDLSVITSKVTFNFFDTMLNELADEFLKGNHEQQFVEDHNLEPQLVDLSRESSYQTEEDEFFRDEFREQMILDSYESQ